MSLIRYATYIALLVHDCGNAQYFFSARSPLGITGDRSDSCWNSIMFWSDSDGIAAKIRSQSDNASA